MNKYLALGLGFVLSVMGVFGAEDVAGAVQGTVEKIDTGARTVIVKTAAGTKETFRFVDRTAVHGANAASAETKEGLHGLKEGSVVAVHYTTKGTQKTAHEIDDIGKDGLHSAEGTVKTIDRGAKTITVKTADGAEESYRLADRAARDSAKDIGAGAQTSEKVTVYYTEEAGHKVAHFFKKVF